MIRFTAITTSAAPWLKLFTSFNEITFCAPFTGIYTNMNVLFQAMQPACYRLMLILAYLNCIYKEIPDSVINEI